MVLVGVAVGVGEVGVRAADLHRAAVHQLHKAVHRAGNQHGHRIRAVVARGQHEAQQQIAEAHGLARVHGNQGAVAGDACRRLGNGDLLLQRDSALNAQQQRHDLRGAGRVHAVALVLAEEHVAGGRVHQHGRLGIEHVRGQLRGVGRVVVLGRARKRRLSQRDGEYQYQ